MNLSETLKMLELECRTQISVTGLHEAFQNSLDLKLTPDQYLHRSSFCRAQKLSDNNQSCSRNKKRSVRIAALGHTFHGFCPFGVEEYVQPVLFQGKLAAVCYFSILQETVPLEELRKKAAWLVELIRMMISIYFTKQPRNGKQRTAEFYRERCVSFLDLHYAENISAEDLAEHLNVNPAYFSVLFRKTMGMTFRAALTGRRLHEAKLYLKLHRDLNITAISRLCGFSDSNYFCLVFHRKLGCSPKEYRNYCCPGKIQQIKSPKRSG